MVFIREQGVPAELEWDELDAGGMHLIAMDAARNAIGTARLLHRMSKGRRSYGSTKGMERKRRRHALMRRLLEEAGKRQIRQVTLNAQVHAAGFYARFGFLVAGKQFMEAGIPHVRMVLLADRPVDLA